MEPMKNPVVVEVVVPAAPAEVYNRLATVSSWDTWMVAQKPNVKCEKSGVLALGDKFKWNGGGAPIKSWIVEAVPGERLAWRGSVFGLLKAHHRWELEETTLEGYQGTATRVVISEVMSGFLSFAMTDAMLSKTNTEWGEALRASFAT